MSGFDLRQAQPPFPWSRSLTGSRTRESGRLGGSVCASKSGKAPIASEAVRRIDVLFEIERARLEQVHAANAKGLRQFVEGNDCRVTASSLKAANILLAETRNFAELLPLSQQREAGGAELYS